MIYFICKVIICAACIGFITFIFWMEYGNDNEEKHKTPNAKEPENTPTQKYMATIVEADMCEEDKFGQEKYGDSYNGYTTEDYEYMKKLQK